LILNTPLMDGILRCTRYAFGPNRLHYCGPDANAEILSYIQNQAIDPGLAVLMRGFKTMFPYLRLIASANQIADPFDDRVVEAYWLGNRLLDNVGKPELYDHLIDEQHLKKRLSNKKFDELGEKIGLGAVPHHSFHVLDIWKRTGHLDREHTLESLDSCRISWGRVTKIDGPNITVNRRALELAGGKLILGPEKTFKTTRTLEAETDIEQLVPGQIISIHWGVPCEVITAEQAATLQKYTLKHLALANQTI
jgi:hypothetical protein